MSKGKISWYSTIRMKVVLVVVISCTVVLGGLSAYNTISEQARLSAELTKLARVTTQRLSKHLIEPMWDLDRELVNTTLEAEMLEDNIHAIVVWDEDRSTVFAARERAPNGLPTASNGAITGDLIKAQAAVNNGTQEIGQVAVFVSKEQLKRQLQASTTANLVTLVTMIVVMAVVISIVMNQVIIGPITRLARHADDISHGDLKQNIVAESNDEIGQLAEAFHRMQNSLRVAFRRLYAKTK
jgi:HAMP domain-containing protein